MAGKTVGELIKEARTKAGLTQEELAAKVEGLSASEVSKAEHGEKELTQAELKGIAKATGVTQKSLLEAAAGKTSAKKSTAKSTAKSTSKSDAKSTKSTGKSSTKSSTKSTSSKSSGSLKLTAKEKKLVELYRKADDDTQKMVDTLLNVKKDNDAGLMETLLGGAMELLGGLGK